ncbi:MAG TPA: hypothetical protein VHF22_02060 [Planctomycetota bacterium]|nr:hypothetical protein [Planctomycetota bacterium]
MLRDKEVFEIACDAVRQMLIRKDKVENHARRIEDNVLKILDYLDAHGPATEPKIRGGIGRSATIAKLLDALSDVGVLKRVTASRGAVYSRRRELGRGLEIIDQVLDYLQKYQSLLDECTRHDSIDSYFVPAMLLDPEYGGGLMVQEQENHREPFGVALAALRTKASSMLQGGKLRLRRVVLADAYQKHAEIKSGNGPLLIDDRPVAPEVVRRQLGVLADLQARKSLELAVAPMVPHRFDLFSSDKKPRALVLKRAAIGTPSASYEADFSVMILQVPEVLDAFAQLFESALKAARPVKL